MCFQGHPSFVSLPPLPEGGENPELEVIDEDAEVEEISLASAHSPEEGEGAGQEEEEERGVAQKKRRLKRTVSPSTDPQLELEDDDSSSSSPIVEEPAAVAPIRMAPPSRTPGFTRLVDVHNLMDSDDEDARYTFTFLLIILDLRSVLLYAGFVFG